MIRFGERLAMSLAAGALAVTGLVMSPASAQTTLCSGVSNAEVKKCDPAYAADMSMPHWRMFAGHNCTNYVAWHLGVNGVPEPKRLMGNARDWVSNAKALGVLVDNKPSVGAVGAWPGRNHVVYVEEVGAGYLITSEDNYPGYYPKGMYRKIRVNVGESAYPTQFIHFKDQFSGPTPTIAGTPKVGSTLTVTAGTWKPSGVALTYQWFSDGVPVFLATATQYAITSEDLGHVISVRVTGTKTGAGSASMTSANTPLVTAGTLTNSAIPEVTGTPKVGSTLTTSTGTWQPSGITFAYQWIRSGEDIPDAIKRTYVLSTADLGKTVSVEVIAIKSGYQAAIKGSASTPVITPGTIANTAAPTISGTPKVGETLTLNGGTWTPDNLTYAYQWLRDGVALGGATQTTYALTPEDSGKTIAVRVTGSKVGFTNLVRTTASTVAVGVGTLTNSEKPSITGAPKVGSTLTAADGVWAPGGATYHYQWFAGGTAVSGATAKTFIPASAQLNKTMTVRVTASKDGYANLSADSPATTAVTGAAAKVLVNSKAPHIPINALVGKWITVNTGTWSPSGVSFTYQWYRGGKAVTGGTRNVYKFTSADVGKKVMVKVT
ncbi:MAG: CHAP domain-containing protein, partial [Aeromicrobium sp.]